MLTRRLCAWRLYPIAKAGIGTATGTPPEHVQCKARSAESLPSDRAEVTHVIVQLNHEVRLMLQSGHIDKILDSTAQHSINQALGVLR